MGAAYPGAKRSGVTPEPVEPMTFTQAAVEASALCDILPYENGESMFLECL